MAINNPPEPGNNQPHTPSGAPPPKDSLRTYLWIGAAVIVATVVIGVLLR